MSRRKICIFCESWESGGIESFLYNVLKSINKDGLDIDIIAAQMRPSVFSDELKAMGVDLIELSGSQKRLTENYRRFKKILKERRYDAVHLNIFHAVSFRYGAIAKKCGVGKLIAHSHNTAIKRSAFLRPFKVLLHNVCKQLYYNVFTDFWACSHAAAEFMFPKSVVSSNGYKMIPDGIDTSRFAFDKGKRDRTRRELGISDELLIVNIGRLSEQKNQIFLLDVLKELIRHGVKCVLLLVGEGDKEAELKEKTNALGLSDEVIFYGTTPDVENILCAADVFAFPSLFEGLGIVAVEAQASALPVVCSEYVPSEAFVSDNISAAKLSDGAGVWADMIIKAARAADRTSNTADLIKEKGYDIKSVAESIEKTYRKPE